MSKWSSYYSARWKVQLFDLLQKGWISESLIFHWFYIILFDASQFFFATWSESEQMECLFSIKIEGSTFQFVRTLSLTKSLISHWLYMVFWRPGITCCVASRKWTPEHDCAAVAFWIVHVESAYRSTKRTGHCGLVVNIPIVVPRGMDTSTPGSTVLHQCKPIGERDWEIAQCLFQMVSEQMRRVSASPLFNVTEQHL